MATSTTTKITKRDRFTTLLTLIDAACEADWAGYDFTDLAEFCEKEIAALDNKAVKAKEAAAKRKDASDALTEAVAAVLTEDLQTIAEITEQIEGEDITQAKVVSRLSRLVKANRAVREEVTVEATEGSKKSKRAAFRLA